MIPDPAPLHEEIMHPAPGGTACWLRTKDGIRIRFAHWRSGSNGTILFLNGRTEYVEKYGLAASAFATRGFSFATFDWRGQGLSETVSHPPGICHVDDFLDYQHDVKAVRSALSKLALPRPLFLVSHSMGGAIGLRALHEGLAVNAAVFCAPMWRIRFPPPAQFAARVLSAAAVRVGWSRRFVPGSGPSSHFELADSETNCLTSDAAIFSFLGGQLRLRPELSRGGPSCSWMHTAIRECHRLMSVRPPNLKSLVLLGTDERVVDPEAVRTLCAAWPEVELELIEGARHELLLESGELRQLVFDRTADFFLAYS